MLKECMSDVSDTLLEDELRVENVPLKEQAGDCDPVTFWGKMHMM
jgi:hypothetical protein